VVADVGGQISGAKLGRYVVLERLGAGGMGVVYAAWDPELDRRVAIKVIGERHSTSRQLLRRRLKREAQTMAKLRHPNVVTVYDVGEADGRLFVAMEYVEGVNLREWARAASRSGPELLAVFLAAGTGLAAAHAQGIVHRDFKPDNVIVAKDGRVVVLDFGLASWATSPSSDTDAQDGDSNDPLSSREMVVAEPSQAPLDEPSEGAVDLDMITMPGTVLGTPAYMAPEQRRGRIADARSDQYSFCTAMWEALSGKLPFGRGKRALVRARTERLVGFERRDIPASVERALRRGLAWRPEDRFAHMNALLAALAPKPRRWPYVALAGSLLAVSTVLAVFGLAGAETPASDEECVDGHARVEKIWNEAAADELGRVFEQRGEAAASEWPYLRSELDRWAGNWVAVDGELCQRYGSGGAPAQQLDCLDRQLLQLEATVEVLATITRAEVVGPTHLLASIAHPHHNREASTGERARELPVVESERRRELEQVIDRVALARQLSRLPEAERDSARLLAETDVRGLESLHRRIAKIRADTLVDMQRSGEAVEAALDGFAAAERSGEALLRLHGLIDVASAYSRHQDPVNATRWLALADALAGELTLDRPTRAELAATTAYSAMVDGRFDVALEAWDRALAATDSENERFIYLERMHNRATTLFKSKRALEGLEQLRLCERLFTQLVGPRHEKLLQLRLDIADAEEQAGMHEQARADYLDVAAQYEDVYDGPTGYSVAARGHAAVLRDKLGDCAGGLAELEPLMPLALEHMAYPTAVLGNMLRRRVTICDYAAPGAVEWAERTLALYRDALGDNHRATVQVHVDLALARLAAEQPEAALTAVNRALEIYASIDPDNKLHTQPRADAVALRSRIEASLADLDRD
jgi:predicted Ser/Thr protein kinase/tetratricopeptide (TPR) repeat protein